jgi:hypothetical protein
LPTANQKQRTNTNRVEISFLGSPGLHSPVTNLNTRYRAWIPYGACVTPCSTLETAGAGALEDRRRAVTISSSDGWRSTQRANKTMIICMITFSANRDKILLEPVQHNLSSQFLERTTQIARFRAYHDDFAYEKPLQTWRTHNRR